MLWKQLFRISFCILISLLVSFMHSPVATHAKQVKNRFYYEQRGEAVWDIKTKQKVVAITFDDGPHPKYTKQILDLLAEHHAKATFFVVGNRVSSNKELIKRMADEGHELANHTYSHARLQGISEGNFTKELLRTEMAIESIVGKKPTLFRPPLGYYDEKTIAQALKHHYLTVMWSWHQDTMDWSNPGTQKIIRTVLNNIQKGDIILFHDFGGNRSQTVRALQEILPALIERGYRFVTVSELLQYNDHFQIPLETPFSPN